ncbi:DegT/DnrJ/EryC1/StrS family aminotransferase [Thiorhodovibrio frisius]|uniref:Putative PLP-dependent enzyme possibly involved in cell wall biogenesis n=1 Tax=Thiorhodovibrio frisius TaxID=631362 RepID=H8Z0A0_9GAMM|nr:DegT/DnrJ/EryC1/StrS family aminotransferase [Thiorhodovibrio frisius]EIC22308.1 putative PLP-dependent enzyme possibly involved in cell wall biogenesis [Thiorhodovibrio frisius]WPL24605.1 dTDP-3-amino-3,6-dideoxy-alpha-D-galactopyranose transaminase [Thiorhodovibrio frisius]
MQFSIPFSGRAHLYTDEEIALVAATARESVPLTQGYYLNAFESAFKIYTGAKHAFAVSNATAALEMAAQLCLFQPGDEVIVPAHTFTASAYPFVKQGARIVWADFHPATRVITADTIAACLTARTKAIVVVHLYGYGADMPAIMALARQHGLLVIEDAAQALGVRIQEHHAGTFGDFGAFSFHSHKNLSTLGEGGMLTVQEDGIAALIPMLRHNGHCGFADQREDYWIPAMGNVDLPEWRGYSLMPNNVCLGEVECALGAKLLERADRINREKRERALAVIAALSDIPELTFHCVTNERHNYHLLVARIAHGWRDAFIRTMANQHRIQCIVQYCPLYRYPLYRKLGFGAATCPNTDDFFDNMVSFPFHHALLPQDLETIVSATRGTIETLRTQ